MPWKLAAILHADDPILLGCSRAAAQHCLDKLACWAYRHKAAFHVTHKSTVSMVTPSISGSSGALPLHPLVLPDRGGIPDRYSSHKTISGLEFCGLQTLLSMLLFKHDWRWQRNRLHFWSAIDMAVAIFRAKVLPVLHSGSWL